MELKTINLNDIVIKFNSRSQEKTQDVTDLMASIKERGLLQPVGVVPLKNGKFELVLGNRRFQATKKLGNKEIKAVVYDAKNDFDKIVDNLVENIQRKDLSVFEFGRYIHMLINKFELSKDEAQIRLSISKGRLDNALDIFERIPKKFIDDVKDNYTASKKDRVGSIPVSHAAIVLRYHKSYPRLTKEKVSQILDLIKKDASIGTNHLPAICEKVAAGVDLKKALDTSNKIIYANVIIPIMAKEHAEILKKSGMRFGDYIKKQLYDGKIIKKV